MMYGCILRRSLRAGSGLLARNFSQKRQAARAVPEKWLSCRHLSISIPHEGSFDLEEPFEVQAAPEAEEAEGGLHSPTVQTGRLSRQLIRLRADECVTPVLQKWVDEGNPITKNAGIVAITNLKRHRRYKRALEVADFVWSKQVYEMDDTDHMYRLYLTGQAGTIEDVERCFAEIPDTCASERVHNQFIACYLTRGMILQAESVFEKLKNSGNLNSALPYSQFLSLYGRQQQYDKVSKLMDEMISANIAIDTRTYNLVLGLFQKQGDSAKVLTIYKDMKDRGAAPDSFTFSMVIKAYMESGMEEEAQRLAEEMRSGSPKDPLLVNDLMLAVYADQGNEKELKNVWKRVQGHSDVSARSYGVMIESLGKLGLIQEAEDLAIKAERKRGKLVSRIFNALLEVYARHGRMEAAEKLMLRITKARLRPTTVTYRHLISGYLKISQLEKALEYLKTSRESLSFDHCKPWLASFVLVLDYVAERGEVELAESIFETFTAAGSYRSTPVYNILLKVYLRSSKCAKGFVERMSDDGFQPDSETLEMLEQMQSFISSS